LNGLLRCFDHLQCLSLFVIFFCIRKLLVPFLFNGNLCNLFSSFEKTRSLFLFKINFVRRNYFELIFFWWALVSLLLYFFSSSGEWQVFIVLRFTFFIVMKNITVFFRFSWLSVISQRDIVDHWHGYIHYTSYLRKSGLFCSICCKTTCCGCMVLEGYVEVCNLRSMSWSFSNFFLILRYNIIVFE